MNPRVSVIIPVFNAEKYLRPCLDSVRDQTLKELEIICIDDGSTDSSGNICDEYAAHDERFVVIHQPNAGQSAARNKGIELARGKYIAFLDSDDWADLEMCEKAYRYAEQNASEVVQFLFHVEPPSPKFIRRLARLTHEHCTELFEKMECVEAGYCVVWNRLYLTEFLRKNRIRFLEGHLFEDEHFSRKVAWLARRIDILHEKLIFYRYGVGYSNRPGEERKKIQYIPLFTALKDDFEKCGAGLDVMDLVTKLKYYWFRKVYFQFRGTEFEEGIRQMITSSIRKDEWRHLVLPDRHLSPKTAAFFWSMNGKPVRAWLVRLLGIFPRWYDQVLANIAKRKARKKK